MPGVKTSSDSEKETVHVLFGGTTAERNVSVASGTNVWLKLRTSEKYSPKPFFMADEGHVWSIPYAFALHHTAEEIQSLCAEAKELEPIRALFRQQVRTDLGLAKGEQSFTASCQTLAEFIKNSPLIFSALHGGIGENGTIQQMFEDAATSYVGCGPAGSRLGADKFETAVVLKALNSEGIRTARKERISTEEFLSCSEEKVHKLFDKLMEQLKGFDEGSSIIVKPGDDGCSAGVVRLRSKSDLWIYQQALKTGLAIIAPNMFQEQSGPVEMPSTRPNYILFEEFIVTDEIRTVGNKLELRKTTGLIEVTVGITGAMGKVLAMNPSLTIASGSVLSLEEKFQGGTGINITPPPREYVSEEVCEEIKRRIALVANTLQLSGISRIDAFVDRKTGEMIIIEANTLPGLTPSTVIYHQALEESPPIYPRAFLEKLISYRWIPA